MQYTYVDVWQDRPEIQIYPDYTVIDGREYTDIWISNEAAEKFRVNAFDFKTAYNIVSNSSGNFASGVGTINGVPIYHVGNNNVSQIQRYDTTGVFDLGDGTVKIQEDGAFNSINVSTYPNKTPNYTFQTSWVTSYMPFTGQLKYVSPNVKFLSKNSRGNAVENNLPNWSFTSDPFSYSYVSQEIPADQALTQDTGMMIRVPSDDGNGNRYFDTWLHDNPEFDQGEPVTIDVNLDPTIETKLDDLLDIIIPIIPMINNNLGGVTFVENHTEPAPQPDTLLPDTYWSQLENKLDQIRQTIQNLTPDFSSIIQAIQTIPSAITQAVTNITQPIVQAINNLGDTILQDIETGPIKLLDKLLDVLRSLFFPILATLKSFLGIWHYVVEWVNNITVPFAWIFGIMSTTSSVLISPIYALIAGSIVIAVYRRFGR